MRILMNILPEIEKQKLIIILLSIAGVGQCCSQDYFLGGEGVLIFWFIQYYLLFYYLFFYSISSLLQNQYGTHYAELSHGVH